MVSYGKDFSRKVLIGCLINRLNSGASAHSNTDLRRYYEIKARYADNETQRRMFEDLASKI
jgi:hypothetical protein